MAGLSTLDWSQLHPSTHVVSLCLIILGSAQLLTLAPVVLRLRAFELQAEAVPIGELEEHRPSDRLGHGGGSSTSGHSLTHAHTRLISFENFSHAQLETAALRKLVKVVLGYWLGIHLLGFL